MPRSTSSRVALIVLVGIAASMGACRSRYSPYTLTTIQDLNLSREDVKSVQFYVELPFTLQYVRHSSDSRIARHEVKNTKVRFEKNVEVVERAGAEAVDLAENYIKVRVADDLILTFRPDRESPHGVFFLSDINEQTVEHEGTIFFRENYYKILLSPADPGDPASPPRRPRLLYEKSSVQRHRRERERVTGVWLEERDRERSGWPRRLRRSSDEDDD